MIKVSVVVATHQAGTLLDDRTRQSLLDQTLPADEFETIFVDDASIGRARNVGSDRARGEYLIHVDQEDVLFPDALRRLYEYAVDTGADVVLGKETIKGDPLTPGWPTWQRDVPAATLDQAVLHCITPHKLYRRALLVSAGIRFPEGRVELVEHTFNAAVYAAADTIAILADYPCYQQLVHDHALDRSEADADVFLDALDRSLAPIEALPEGGTRHELLKRWYVRGVLRRLGPGEHPIRDRLLADADRVLAHVPAALDEGLEPIDRVRSWLLRRGDRPGLDALRDLDQSVRLGVDPVRSVDWEAGTLLVTITGSVLAGDAPYPVRTIDGRPGLDLSGIGLPDPPPDEVTAIGDRLGAAVVDLGLRGRQTGVEWPIPDRAQLAVVDQRLTFRVAARVALRDGRLHAWLRSAADAGDEIYDARLHLTGLGYERIAPVRAENLAERPALIDGLPAVAYQTNDGRLALDLTRKGEGRRILRLTRVDPAISSVRQPDDGPLELRLGLTGLHTAGDSALTGVLAYESTAPATLAADGERQRAEVRFRPTVGDVSALLARFQDRTSPTGAELTLTDVPTIRARPEPAAPASSTSGPRIENSGALRTERATAAWADGRLEVTVVGTTKAAADSLGLSIRGRAAGLEIPVAGDGRVSDGRFEVTGQVDPTVLAEDIWDVRLAARSAGQKLRDPVRIGILTEQPAVVDGRAMVAYATKDGGLALDLTETARTVVGAARVEPGEVTADGDEIVIGLRRVHVHGPGRIDGQAASECEVPARLIGTDEGALIVAEAPARSARRDLRFAFTGHRSSRRLAIEYGERTATVLVTGEPAVTVDLAAPADRPVGSPRNGEPDRSRIGSRLRRGLGRVWKRRGGGDNSS